LSCPNDVPKKLHNQIPYRHLVTVAQLADDVDGVEAILRRSGELSGDLDVDDRSLLAERIGHVQYWLDHFAPAGTRFAVQAELPPGVTEDDRAFLGNLRPALESVEWTGQGIHDAIHVTAADMEIGQGKAFGAVYRSLLGQDRGPRAGFFLSSLDRELVLRRFSEAAA
jgi:lysyl-tRNA synthetase class 1